MSHAHLICEGRDDATLVIGSLIAKGFRKLEAPGDWDLFRILNRTFSSLSLCDLPDRIRDSGGISVLKLGANLAAVDDYRGATAAVKEAANSFKEMAPRGVDRIALILDADDDVQATWDSAKSEFEKHTAVPWPADIAAGLAGIDVNGIRFHVFLWPDGGNSVGSSEDMGIALIDGAHPNAIAAAEVLADTGKSNGDPLGPTKRKKTIVSASASLIVDPAAANWVKIRDVADAHPDLSTVPQLAPIMRFLDDVLA